MSRLDNLATFVEVVRAGTLAGAARRLGVPKSTVGRRVARLEAMLDVQLIFHHGRKISLSDDARVLYDRVAGAIDTVEQALGWAGDASATLQGTVRVTAPADFGRMLLAPALADFGSQFPDIIVDLQLTDRVVDLVQEGFDVAVRAGPLAPETSSLDLISRRLFVSVLQLAAHPRRAAQLRTLEDVARAPFVMFRPHGTRQRLTLFDVSDDPPTSVDIEVGGSVIVHDYASMAEFIAADRGVGLVPMLHLRRGVADGRLAAVLPQYQLRNGHISLVYPSRHLPRRVTALLEFLSAALTVDVN